MRAAFRNTIAAAVAAAIAVSGANVAHAQQDVELAPVLTNTATLVDSDGDGLPDIWEEQGVVLADGTEIPLPDWGADPNRPDLFLQLNWMASEYDTLGCDTSAARECANANRTSYAPSTQSLDDLVDLFADHGISLHIDAGEHYTNIPNYSDVHGGETLEYRDFYFDPSEFEAFQLIDTINELGDRANIFRPGVLGDRMRAGSNATGLSLVGDNSFYVANPGGRANDEQVRNTILHEFGHIAAARRYGVATPDVVLLPIGGVARLERVPEEPAQELVVTLAGPAVNLAIALVLYLVLGGFLPREGMAVQDPAIGMAARLLWANLFLALFNLVPAFPMDGGRMLRAFLAYRMGYARATRIAASIGQGLAFLLGLVHVQVTCCASGWSSDVR